MNKTYLLYAGAGVLTICVIGSVFLFFQKNPVPEGTVCTQEVLQCPDGSYIGRTKPGCMFQTCTGSSFVGTLVLNQAGFVLHTDAPRGGTQEVVYVLPLNISDRFNSVVGKRVKVSGVFYESNIFTVVNLELLPGVMSDAHRGVVKVGRSVLVQGVRITVNKIIQDSRCPQDVQCIQAGSLTAEVSLQSNTDKTVAQITLGKDPLLFDSYKISLDDAFPIPLSTAHITPSDYSLTFLVE